MKLGTLIKLAIFLIPATSWGSLVEDYQEARAKMVKGFGLVPSFHRVLEGKEAAGSIDLSRIISVYNAAVIEDPKNPFLAFALGEAYRLRGERADADSHFASSLRNAGGLGDHLLLIELLERKDLDYWVEEGERSLLELKLDMGVSLPLLSTHFRTRGLGFLRAGDQRKAEREWVLANGLDPCQFENQLLLLKFYVLRMNLRKALDIVPSMLLCFKDVQNQGAFFSSILLFLSLALPLGLVVGIWSLFVRYVPCIQHRVFESLPGGFPLISRVIISWALLALPLLWRFPFYLLTLSAIALVWILLSMKERYLTTLFLIILIVSPLLVRTFSLLQIPKDPFHWIFLVSEVQRSGWDRASEEKLANAAQQARDNFSLNFALGLLRKRRGDFSEAKEAYEAALEANPRNSLLYNNLGNVLYAMGDHENATHMYERASQLEPGSALSHYNLAQVHLENMRLVESSAELKRAQDLDFALVSSLTDVKTEHFNRAVADGFLSTKFFWQKIFSQFWNWEALRNNPLIGITLFSILFLAFVNLPARFVRRRALGLRCSLCGRPICHRCQGSFEDQPVCPSCEWRVSGSQSEEIKDKFTQAIIRRSEMHARVKSGVLAFLYPGAGHMFLGAVGRGLFFTLLASLLISRLFLMNMAQGRPPLFDPTRASLGQVLLVALLALTWSWSLISVFKRKERPWRLKVT